MIHHVLVKIWRWLSLPAWLQWRLVDLWTPKYRVAVAAILLNEQRQVLLCEHTYRKEFPWGLPGGNLHFREDPADGMQREVFEETGLQVKVIRPLMALTARDFRQITVLYLCTPSGGAFQENAEVSRIQFFEARDLPERILPSEREMIVASFRILEAEEDPRSFSIPKSSGPDTPG